MAKQRMTPAAYKKYKKMYDNLSGLGYKFSEIRDILKIGNGTTQYIANSKNFKEYCALRDTVLARAKAKADRENGIRDEAVAAATSALDQPKTSRIRRSRKAVVLTEEQEVTPHEAPVNIEKLVQSHFNDLRDWLENDYSKILIDKVAGITNVPLPPEDEGIEVSSKGTSRLPWWSKNKSN